MIVRCDYCGKKVDKYIGHLNRSREMGNNVYCDRKCSGLGRRTNETDEQKKEYKAWYDGFIRVADAKRFKKERAEFFKKDYAANPEKYRRERQRRMKYHIKYCRRPEYRKKKQDYDRERVAKKHYGKYWEAAIALRELGNIVDNRQAKADQKSINKTQNRKRYANKNTKRKELESCVMGLYQPG